MKLLEESVKSLAHMIKVYELQYTTILYVDNFTCNLILGCLPIRTHRHQVKELKRD